MSATTETAVARSSKSGSGGWSRWCPTPGQVKLLEEMFERGLRTPTATQIQHITARLSLYGQIETKNVFFWFQNHRARDRKDLQKKLMAAYQQQRLLPSYNAPYYHHLFPLQGGAGVVEDKGSCKNVMVNEWNVDQTCYKVMCDCSCTIMTMMESTSQHCTREPPKTLQLFPTTPELTLNPSQRQSYGQDSNL